MRGEGVFSDPRVGSHLDPGTPGPASDWRPGMVVANGKQDNVSDVLAALQAYQLSIPAPPPPEGSFNHAKAPRGNVPFTAKGGTTSNRDRSFTDIPEERCVGKEEV